MPKATAAGAPRHRLVSVRHEWGQPDPPTENREALSDHAALVVEVAAPTLAAELGC